MKKYKKNIVRDDNSFKTIEKVVYISGVFVIGAGIITFSLLPAFAFNKERSRKSNCNITNKHAHYYKYSNGLGIYLDSEKIHNEEYTNDYYGDIIRTDKYVLLNDEEYQLTCFLADNQLFSIDHNKNTIDKLLKTYNSHTEYECKSNEEILDYNNLGYSAENEVPGIGVVDNTTYVWTTNFNYDSFTGNMRDCYCTYNAYKVMKQSDGSYLMEKSDSYENFYDIPSEYEYIKPEFYNLYYSDVYNLNEEEEQNVRNRSN